MAFSYQVSLYPATNHLEARIHLYPRQQYLFALTYDASFLRMMFPNWKKFTLLSTSGQETELCRNPVAHLYSSQGIPVSQ